MKTLSSEIFLPMIDGISISRNFWSFGPTKIAIPIPMVLLSRKLSPQGGKLIPGYYFLLKFSLFPFVTFPRIDKRFNFNVNYCFEWNFKRQFILIR
jgi:hypothetical protein